MTGDVGAVDGRTKLQEAKRRPRRLVPFRLALRAWGELKQAGNWTAVELALLAQCKVNLPGIWPRICSRMPAGQPMDPGAGAKINPPSMRRFVSIDVRFILALVWPPGLPPRRRHDAINSRTELRLCNRPAGVMGAAPCELIVAGDCGR